MNIALVCDSVNIQNAGSLVSTWRFAYNLAKGGHKIVLITTGPEKSVSYVDGVKIIRIKALPSPGSNGGFYMPYIVSQKRIKRILLEEKVQVVHVMIPTPLCLTASRAAKKLNLPLIAYSHTQPENILMDIKINSRFVKDLFYRYIVWAYSIADMVVCPTRFAEKKLKEHGIKVKTIVISNGVELDKFKKVKVPHGFYERFRLDKKQKRILFVGRIWPEKNIAVLIRAMPSILKKVKFAHLDIVGEKVNQYKKLMNLTKKLNLKKHVTFLGRVSDEDLVYAYNACDVFCLPSFIELEGMVVLEAMALGKPIVISDAPESASKFYVDGNGFVFRTTSPSDLSEKICAILLDEDMMRKMGKKSLEISKDLSIKKSVSKLERLYAEWIEKKQ